MAARNESAVVRRPRLDVRNREIAWFAIACGWLVLMLICAPLGWFICDRRAAQLSAAGAGFDEIDKASDALFLGIICSFVAGLAFLFCLSAWLAGIARRRRGCQPTGDP